MMILTVHLRLLFTSASHGLFIFLSPLFALLVREVPVEEMELGYGIMPSLFVIEVLYIITRGLEGTRSLRS